MKAKVVGSVDRVELEMRKFYSKEAKRVIRRERNKQPLKVDFGGMLRKKLEEAGKLSY